MFLIVVHLFIKNITSSNYSISLFHLLSATQTLAEHDVIIFFSWRIIYVDHHHHHHRNKKMCLETPSLWWKIKPLSIIVRKKKSCIGLNWICNWFFSPGKKLLLASHHSSCLMHQHISVVVGSIITLLRKHVWVLCNLFISVQFFDLGWLHVSILLNKKHFQRSPCPSPSPSYLFVSYIAITVR